MKATRHDEQRHQVVEAAAAVIRQFGFQKTTMNDIAKALRMGKSSLYHYFPNKELIFVEVLKNDLDGLRAEFLGAIESERTAEGKLRAYVLKRTELLARKMREHMELLEATAERYELLLKIHEIYDKEEIRIISSILEAGVQAGQFALDDVKETAAALVTAFRAFEYPVLPASRSEKVLSSLLDILFRGILRR